MIRNDCVQNSEFRHENTLQLELNSNQLRQCFKFKVNYFFNYYDDA